jgi:3-(3-hydroxy-phenyl)propionate hydroxylase
MLNTYQFKPYPWRKSEEQIAGKPQRHPVVVVGAGPVGLVTALDLGRRGVRTVLIDDNDVVSVGSRGVCYAKRPLEILDRLGAVQPMLDKGVSWNVGKVFFRDRLSYQFDLLPESDHKMPAMINLQQYYLEEFLIAACEREPNVEIRFRHKLVSLDQRNDHVALRVETPDGEFDMEAQWLVACDGAGSPVRGMVGADFQGKFFQDRFLIADVVMKADFPPERWFWFDPPFHRNQSALLHRQADDVWRLDFQLGWDVDPEEAKKPENVIPRVKAMLGDEREFELEWVSVYQFACRRIDEFRHGRVIFAGDSAHQVSPFGARGANTGIQDADNLAWKLQLVIDGAAPEALIDTYTQERAYAADDNLMNSTRSTDFITPKSASSRLFRDAVLDLAERHAFARPLVNSGRLSTPTPYVHSSLNTPDEDAFAGRMAPGTNCVDAPVAVAGQPSWLLEQLGAGFTVLIFGDPPAAPIVAGRISVRVLRVGRDLEDVRGVLAARYDARPGTTYLIRPDQHVAARWRSFDETKIRAALARAIHA